jgi:S1-C subfamily serine protease
MTEKGSTEEFEVTVNNVVRKVMELIHEGNVRRITLKRSGRTLVEIPLNAGLTVGAVTALVAPLLLGVGALTAVLAKVTVVVERPPKPAE